jgi:hypothetical protein
LTVLGLMDDGGKVLNDGCFIESMVNRNFQVQGSGSNHHGDIYITESSASYIPGYIPLLKYMNTVTRRLKSEGDQPNLQSFITRH